MAESILEKALYSSKKIEVSERAENKDIGKISEWDRLLAAKQILLGLAVLFLITMLIFVYNPTQGAVLLEICKTVFPPLATLIIAFYFKNK